jgi:hypothetical protein
MDNSTLTTKGNGTPRFEVITGKRKITSATSMNQHVKRSVHRLVFNSELDIRSLRQVARLVGITGPRSEAKVLDVIRETVREALRPQPPSGGLRRVA